MSERVAEYELIIVGGGPAGMTAAVYAARKRLEALLLAGNIGGQALWAPAVENYMGYQYIEGTELMDKFQKQVASFPIEQRIGDGVTSISRVAEGFEVKTDKGRAYRARSVIIATGKRPQQLDVPGEERLKGRGVSYCAICDGPVFGGEKVAVVGGGNSALEAANDMVRIAEHVHLASRTPLTADEVLIDRASGASNLTMYLDHEVLRIEGSTRVEGIVLRDMKTGQERDLEVHAVFVEVGLIPNSDLVSGIVHLNELGEIQVSCSCETGVPGLFAAGDVTNVPEKQIVVSAGEGAKAAIQAHRYLQRL